MYITFCQHNSVDRLFFFISEFPYSLCLGRAVLYPQTTTTEPSILSYMTGWWDRWVQDPSAPRRLLNP